MIIGIWGPGMELMLPIQIGMGYKDFHCQAKTHNGNLKSVMHFINGTGPCSNGVYRSSSIHFFCGTTTGVLSVDEFSKCEYTVHFSVICS